MKYFFSYIFPTYFSLFLFSVVIEFLIQSSVENLQSAHYIRAELYPKDRIVVIFALLSKSLVIFHTVFFIL